MEKAFLYLRVSTPGQVEGCGLDRQEGVCRAYAGEAGYGVAGVFREEGVSGAKDETERPAFQEMLTAILSNGVKTVIVESLDRLAREYRIQESLLIYLASKGVDLVSARTGENVTQAIQADPLKKALVQIQGVFSELEKNQLVRRLQKARDLRSAQAKRRIEGRKPYGETPEEQKVIQRIRAMRRTRKNKTPGMTLQQIADRLNDEGIMTKDGKEWTATQIFNVVGKAKQGKEA
ncbi:MAG TPA: recombinase family protein [Desulfobaccales bacterium]